MKQNSENILDKIGRRDGMTVPEGFFAEFNRQMAASLPERVVAQEPVAAKRSLWFKVRPYVYMAAMFAGIWLMLQLFSVISHPGSLSPMESNPVMAEALSNDGFMFDYIIDDAGIDQWDILDEMAEDGTLEELDFSGFADPSDFSTINDR